MKGEPDMKIMIASDIHGSAKYCKKLLAAFKNEAADRLILLGDILYHGPRNDLPEEYAPKTVIELLNTHKDRIFAVRGNCEAEVDQMVLEFPVMADYMLLPVGERMVYATPGHIYNIKNLPPMRKGDILLTGHTHVMVCEDGQDFVYMNPGSVSIPKNDSPRGYIVLEDKRFIFKTLEGEYIKVFEA